MNFIYTADIEEFYCYVIVYTMKEKSHKFIKFAIGGNYLIMEKKKLVVEKKKRNAISKSSMTYNFFFMYVIDAVAAAIRPHTTQKC